MSITFKQAYDYYVANTSKLSVTEISENLLLDSGFRPLKCSGLNGDDKGELTRLVGVVRKRYGRLRERTKNKKTVDWNGIFFSLEKSSQDSEDLDIIPTTMCSNLKRSSTNLEDDYYPDSDSDSDADAAEIETHKVNSVMARKKFVDCSPITKRRRTQAIFDHLNEFAADEGMTIHEVIDYIGFRTSYQRERKRAKVYGDLSREIFDGCNSMSASCCLYLKQHLELSKQKYTDLRLMLKPYVELVPYNLLRLETEKLLPEIQPFRHGIRCSLGDVVINTLSRLPDKIIRCLMPHSDSILSASFIYGLDGSGSHSEYNSESSLKDNVDTSHFIVSGLALSKITQLGHDGILYSDQKLASSMAERPLLLCPGKEDRKIVGEIMKIFDAEVRDVTKSHQKIQYIVDDNPVELSFEINIKMTQLDGKAVSMGTGLQGAYCSMCTTSEEEGKNIERIRNGFTIDRCVADNLALFESLVLTDEDGNEYVPKNPGDYATRTGLTQRPLTEQNLHQNIPITHAYLRFLSHFQEVLYRQRAKVFIMGRGKRISDNEKQRIKAAKLQIQKEVRFGPLAMKFDVPDKYGHGGNSDTANVARKFFSAESRPHVVDLFNPESEETRKNISLLLQNISVILRIISSKEKVETVSFEELCIETYEFLVVLFPWQTIPNSLHRVLAHSAEAIKINNCYGLGYQTEEGLEALHKLVRRWRETRARKSHLLDNIKDVFVHLYLRSDPTIRNSLRQINCSNCCGQGHTKRSCPVIKMKKIEAEDDEKILRKCFL